METLNLIGVLSREKLADVQISGFRIGLDTADEQALTTMDFVSLNTRGNSRLEQIASGRSYLRVALSVAGLGLVMQPMSQALQEYTAMQSYYEQVHAVLHKGPTSGFRWWFG